MTAKDVPPAGAHRGHGGNAGKPEVAAAGHRAAPASGFDGYDDDPARAAQFASGNPDDMPDFSAAPVPAPSKFRDSGMDGLDDINE